MGERSQTVNETWKYDCLANNSFVLDQINLGVKYRPKYLYMETISIYVCGRAVSHAALRKKWGKYN